MEHSPEDLCSPPSTPFVGGVPATTPDAQINAARASDVLAELLPPNPFEDIYQSFMEELQAESVSPAVVEENREWRRPVDLCTVSSTSTLGGVSATTSGAPGRKIPATRAPNVLGELLLLNPAEDIYLGFMEELRKKCVVAPAVVEENRERQTLEDLYSTHPASSLGGAAETTPGPPGRKRPAARTHKALAKLLLNSTEDIYMSFMEEVRAKYVAPAVVEAKRERHIRVLMSLRLCLRGCTMSDLEKKGVD